jgi:hypothetical protein
MPGVLAVEVQASLPDRHRVEDRRLRRAIMHTSFCIATIFPAIGAGRFRRRLMTTNDRNACRLKCRSSPFVLHPSRGVQNHLEFSQSPPVEQR